jgi:N-methylhydantoinase B
MPTSKWSLTSLAEQSVRAVWVSTFLRGEERVPMAEKIDSITIATVWHYIQRVCREMRYTAERTATNVLVVTLHDMGYGLWDAEGRVIAIPEGFPVRLISSTFPIRRVREKFAGRIRPGDIYLTNYPRDGAVHLPDWVFIRPVFYQDELLFFTCMGTHVADSGGAQAGSHFLAFDPIAEGLNIPLVKVAENNEYREDVLELILANNRLPDMMRREMASLMGSTTVAEQRMVELLQKYGKDTVMAAVEEMIERTEKAVRAEIATWLEGTYSAEVATDDDGLDFGRPVHVRCDLTIKDGELWFDFSRTDDQVAGMINSYYQQTLSMVLCTTFLFLGNDLAAYHNEGSTKPIHVVTRKGTIVDCRPGALVALGPAVTGGLVNEAVLAVLSEALPSRAVSPYARLISPLIVGRDLETDGVYVYPSFCSAAGAGAVAGYDGYQCACEGGTLGVVGKTDAEEEMARFPWDINRYEFRTDSHGAGRWRGAPGIIWEGVNEGGECNFIGGPWNGFTTQGKGQHGGEATPLNKAYVLRGDEKIDILEPHRPLKLQRGDHLVTLSGGGAGVGCPEHRGPDAVRADVRNELVSVEMARDVYKVVIDPETFEIDHVATDSLRPVPGMFCLDS